MPLDQSHFSLLLTWLQAPHVKAWWDKDTAWTLELVQAKYGEYAKGFKTEDGIKKNIRAFIICCDDEPIGYIQSYNAYDFNRSKPLTDLPQDLGAFDMFIGEPSYLNRGLGSKALAIFFDTHSAHRYTFADPDRDNLAAIRAYEKARFKKCKELPDVNEWWMIRGPSSTNSL